MTGYIGPIETECLENESFRRVVSWHNLISTSSTSPLKLYTLYAPPNHPAGTMHRSKSVAEVAEELAL